ncbi:MAG: PRD domain-containing protein [Acutalibacteraceae bacterium]
MQGKAIIQERCGYTINEDEVGYITLHIHSALGEQVDEGMLIAVIINESIQQVEEECGLSIDVHSLSYTRLLTHMKYLLARLREGEMLALDMEDYTRNAFLILIRWRRTSSHGSRRTLHRQVPKIETGYLAMHIERVCRSEQEKA